uniref:FP protein C-terminal domain-containing protein n=1 Tax=Heliothis virescens TaxID=7102 RepID=A0A2A4K1S6_HELVI
MASECDQSKIFNDDSTPARNVSTNRGNKRHAKGSPSPTTPSSNIEDIQSIIQDVIKAEFSDMLAQFNEQLVSTMNNELETVKSEMKEMVKSMQFINRQFEDFERNQKASSETIKRLEIENNELKTSLANLNMRINNLEQQSRSNNLEIQCMPETKNENLFNIITQLGKVVNCNVQDKDILHCTRTAKVNSSSTRPKSIVLQLASPRLRDHLLASVIEYNKKNPHDKLHSGHLGFGGQKAPIYVTEHLSPNNKSLHAAARVKAKEMHYKYVWVRNGKIFVRKNDGSEYILIKNINSLSKIV